jgi:hypothetical protein
LKRKEEEANRAKEVKGQKSLGDVFRKVEGPLEFTREGVLEAVARFIACEDQVSVGNAEQV